MNEEQYMLERVDEQINWYDEKSSFNQRWFKRLQVISILAASTIPFLTGYSVGDNDAIRILIGVLGLLVACISAMLNLYHFQEHWIEYRATCESLRHEKFLFITKTMPYDNEDAFKILVQGVESLLSKENVDWVNNIKKAAKPNPAKTP